MNRSTVTTPALVILILFSGLAADVQSAQAAAPDAGPTVMIIGDSHVERLGPALARDVRELGGEPVGFLARRGWSTGRYRREGDLYARLTEHGTPDVLVVSLGGNDHAVSRAVYARQLAWVVSEARRAGVREILWIGPASTHLGGRARSRRTAAAIERNTEWQRELLPELGVSWTDSRAFTTEDHARDGLHFNRDGYRHWSEALVEGWTHSDDENARSGVLSRLNAAHA